MLGGSEFIGIDGGGAIPAPSIGIFDGTFMGATAGTTGMGAFTEASGNGFIGIPPA
jgi:hypothetical protein